MLGQLPEGLVGTDPKYPSIVNHDWLQPMNYDNYPSDNNPVRVVPQIAEVWNHDPRQNINMVPNMTVQPLSLRAEDKTSEVVREAKKAMMAGLLGGDLADHLRGRFTVEDIKQASEQLKEVSKESGLLGNVYIDPSAFSSMQDAEGFFGQHRNRLASYIIANEKVSPAFLGHLASYLKKKVVSSVTYDDTLFSKYRNHLVTAGRIPEDFQVTNQEELRAAFLYKKPEEKMSTKKVAKAEKKLTDRDVKEGISKAMKAAEEQKKAHEEVVLLKRIYPVLSFTQDLLHKGKDASDIKQMLRDKFATSDLIDAAPYIGALVYASDSGRILDMVAGGKLSSIMGEELIKLAKNAPRKKMDDELPKQARSTGVHGYFYTMKASVDTDSLDSYRKAALEALRKGFGTDKVLQKLSSVISSDEAQKVLTDAVTIMNASPAGITANVAENHKATIVIEDPRNYRALPDENTIQAKTQEITSFFDGCKGDIDISLSGDVGASSIEIENLNNRAGIDMTLG